MKDHNNHFGTTQTDVTHPGQIIELDEYELDIMVFSRLDANKVIGRPVLYIAVDIYSGMIVGFWISLHYDGATNLLQTIVGDHQQILQNHGVSAPDYLYPSFGHPEEIIVDHSSEYMSDDFCRICRELGIMLLAGPALGSRIETIEQCLLQYYSQFISNMMGMDHIQKKKYSKKLTPMTIDDIWKITCNVVLYYNQQKYKK